MTAKAAAIPTDDAMEALIQNTMTTNYLAAGGTVPSPITGIIGQILSGLLAALLGGIGCPGLGGGTGTGAAAKDALARHPKFTEGRIWRGTERHYATLDGPVPDVAASVAAVIQAINDNDAPTLDAAAAHLRQ